MIRQRRLVKRLLLAALGVLALMSFTLYFVLQYRIKMVLMEVVDMETDGNYTLDFSDHSFSVFKADIKLKNVHFHRVKPAPGETSYNIKIPSFYISINSWKTLLIDKRLVVDSLYAEAPEIRIMETNQIFSGNKVSVQLNDAYQALRQITNKFEVQTLSIKEATLGLYPTDSSQPFIISHLDLGIHNFTWRTKESRHFLLTDDIDIQVKNQDWILAEGDSLSFSRLHFSAKKQRFTIDSCSLRSANIEKGRTINIMADQFFINSSNLTAAYLQNKLIIDTLTCINPVVQIENDAPRKKDSGSFRKLVGKVFDSLSFKYISVVDGQLLLLRKQNGKTVSYASQKSNIRLYDLDIKTGTPSSVSLGDLKFDLDTVRFFTPDSLYVLRVGNFSIHNSDLICRNASFVPASTSGVNIQLYLPQITLKNISLPDLWQKKLKADQAQFERPEIIIKERAGGTRVKIKGQTDPYAILHEFSSVVDVNEMYINEGSLQLQPRSSSGTAIKTDGINAFIQLNELFKSGSLIDIKRTFSKAGVRNFQIITPEMRFTLEGVLIHGSARENYISKAILQLPNGMDLRASGIFWHQFDWKLLYNNKNLKIDQLRFHELDLRYHPSVITAQKTTPSLLPFSINNFRIDKLNTQLDLLNGIKLQSQGSGLEVEGLENRETGLQWQDIKAGFQKAYYKKEGTTIMFDSAVFDKQNGSFLKNATVLYGSNHMLLPEVKLSTTIRNTNLSDLHLEYLIINDPKLFFNSNYHTGDGKKTLEPPFNLTADQLLINNAAINFGFPDSSRLGCLATARIDSIRMLRESKDFISHGNLRLSIAQAEWENKKITAAIPALSIRLPEGRFQRLGDQLQFENSLVFQWADAGVRLKDSSHHQLYASGISGQLNYPDFVFRTGEKWNWNGVFEKLKLTDGSLHYSDKKKTVSVRKIWSDVARGDIVLDEASIIPKLTRARFFELSQWQKDYQEIRVGKLMISGADILKFIKDTAIDIQTVTIQDGVLVTSRDKNMPFEHGIEKLMPTKLIGTIMRPVRINTVLLKNATITSNEIAVATQREGSIPFLFVNGEISNINNRPKSGDSLSVSASAVILDHYIRSFRYKESYTDSLSGFHLSARLSPMNLTVFSKITNPLAALDIRRGNADTLDTRMAGNKYGSFGEMKFYYRHLKLRFLNPLDTTRKNFALSFKNFVANELVLRTDNKKPAQVFYIRDTEKFIFNYWFKSIFSGVIASAGIRTDQKYSKQYKQLKQVYSLPPKE